MSTSTGMRTCNDCKGSGQSRNGSDLRCEYCDGSGKVETYDSRQQRLAVQASTLARVTEERDRLREALRQAREFICVQTWPPNKPRTGDTARRREAEGLIVRIDAVLKSLTTTTTGQEEG